MLTRSDSEAVVSSVSCGIGRVQLIALALVAGMLCVCASPLYADEVRATVPTGEPVILEGSTWLHINFRTKSYRDAATRFVVKMLDKKGAKHEGIPEDDVRRIRIAKLRYTKKDEDEPTEMDVDSTPTTSPFVRFPKDIDKSREVRVYVSMHDYVKSTAENPSPVGDERDAPEGGVKVAVVVLSEAATALKCAEAGPSAVMWTDKGFRNVLTVAETHLGLGPKDYDVPDLVLHAAKAPRSGSFTFTPLGPFRFTGKPMEIHVFDGDGNDLVNSGAIVIGEGYTTPRGELEVPVPAVFGKSEFRSFAMMVRGVPIIMDDDAYDGVHCYTVGGSSFADGEVNAAAIAEGTRVLDNWETFTWKPTFTLGTSSVPVWDDQAEKVVDHNVGNEPAWIVSGDDNVGYLPGLVLRANDAGGATTGRVVFRSLQGFQFVADENTKLYVLNAANGDDVSADVSATIEASSSGSLAVEIDDLGEAAGLRLQLVIVNPKVSCDDTVEDGMACFMSVYGSAVGAPVTDNVKVLEGLSETPEPSKRSLRSDPITVHGWTAAASMDD